MSEIYEFADFRLNVRERVLERSGGGRVSLPDKAFDTLCVLVRNAGKLVGKEEILSSVWADAFVEENNLNKSIHAIRRALGDQNGQPKFVETVKKHGFRFVAPVTKADPPRPVEAEERRPGSMLDGQGQMGSVREFPHLVRRSGGAVPAVLEEAETSPADLPAVTEPVHFPELTAVQPGRVSTSRRPVLYVALLALAVVAGAIGLWFYLLGDPDSGLAGGKRSIAILPLKPISTAGRDELYEIGIADSLIQRIGTINGFSVRPLSAIRKYADIEQDPLAAGREQKVDYVLTSNYQLANGRIRVTSQLLNVANGQIEETYKSEKELSDIFAIQDAVADEVGKRLESRFASTSGTPESARGTGSEEAYRLYLQGMYFYDRRTRADALKAVEVLEQAVRIDPNYARAWAGLAHAHRYLINLGDVAQTNIHDETRRSMDAINRALSLDNTVSEAHSALCDNKMYYEYDFVGAEAACKRSIELKPGSPLAHNTYGRFLMTRGRFDEAISELRTAIELEPTSYFHQIVYLTCLTLARRYDEAFRQMDRIAELNPGNAFRLYWQNSGALMTAEPPEQAYERWMRYLRSADLQIANTDAQAVQLYESIYKTSGWPGVMHEQAKRNRENPVEHQFIIAAIHAQIGDKDTAMEFLEKSYARREFWMTHLQFEPRLDSLRGDPRFEDLVRRVESK